MNKESIFFSCVMIIIIFNVGYYLISPNINIWYITIGATTGFFVSALVTGVSASVQVEGSGISDTGIRLIFSTMAILTVLFRVEIPITWSSVLSIIGLIFKFNSIPLGIGLLYPNMTNIFLLNDGNPFTMFGMLIVTVLAFMTVISGLLIAVGG